MKLLRRIKLMFVPEYKIHLPIYTGEYQKNPLRLPATMLLIDKHLRDCSNNTLHMKYNIFVKDVMAAAIESGLISQYCTHYYIANGFTDAINDYTITEIKD